MPAFLSLAVALLPLLFAPRAAHPELDAYWHELSRTVAEGDFEGYAATYHDDAVLVSTFTDNSIPISQALDGWKPGFDATAAGQMTASVEFRFTQRLNDATTAHETGIFKYTSAAQGQEPQSQHIHFEGLLVKRDGAWLMLMEYQKSMATEEEWNAAEPIG